jgi:hypothetical protein
VSSSHTTQQTLLRELEALIAALLGDAPPAEVASLAGQLRTAVDGGVEIPEAALTEIRSAIRLVRGGQMCATVSALLAARSELTMPSH